MRSKLKWELAKWVKSWGEPHKDSMGWYYFMNNLESGRVRARDGKHWLNIINNSTFLASDGKTGDCGGKTGTTGRYHEKIQHTNLGNTSRKIKIDDVCDTFCYESLANTALPFGARGGAQLWLEVLHDWPAPGMFSARPRLSLVRAPRWETSVCSTLDPLRFRAFRLMLLEQMALAFF